MLRIFSFHIVLAVYRPFFASIHKYKSGYNDSHHVPISLLYHMLFPNQAHNILYESLCLSSFQTSPSAIYCIFVLWKIPYMLFFIALYALY